MNDEHPNPSWKNALLWLGQWLLFLGAWLLFVGTLERAELIAGCVAAALAATASHVAWATHLARFSAHLSWLAQAWRLPLSMVTDSYEILAVLLRHLFTRHKAESLLRAVPYEACGPTADEAALPRADAPQADPFPRPGGEVMLRVILDHAPYLVAIWLFVCGLYGVATSRNLVHLVICMAILQSSTYVLLLAIGYSAGSVAPVFTDIPTGTAATDPVVQALTLTDVVVEATVMALLLSLVVQAHKRSGTLDPEALRMMRG